MCYLMDDQAVSGLMQMLNPVEPTHVICIGLSKEMNCCESLAKFKVTTVSKDYCCTACTVVPSKKATTFGKKLWPLLGRVASVESGH